MRNLNRIFICWLLLTIYHQQVSAQWEWQNPSPPGERKGNLFFVTPSTGFILNSTGDILKTTDGGTTWSVSWDGRTSYSIQSFYFADSLRGWFVGNAAFWGHTTDGGETWTTSHKPFYSILKSIYF